MILCSCTRLTCAELREAAAGMLAEDPEAPLTPGRVFRCTGRRIDCGECRALVRRSLEEAQARRTGAAAAPPPAACAAPCPAAPR